MEEIVELKTNEMLLQVASILKEISINILQVKQLEMQRRILENKLLMSTKEVSLKLGGIDTKKIIKMYREGAFQGIEDGKNIKIWIYVVLCG